MKKQKMKLVNFVGLAKLANVTPAAVSQVLRKEAARGSPVPVTPGAHRREKLVDLNHPAIQGYLRNQTIQPSNRNGARPPTGAALEKLKAQTEKLELAAGVLREKHIDREFVLRYLDEFLKTEEGELKAMVDRIIDGLDKEFGHIDRAKLKEIKQILDQPCRDALEMTHHEIDKFKRDTQPGSWT
jgi:hypothetical protein